MPDPKDFLPAPPPMLPFPRGLLRALGEQTREEAAAGYHSALLGAVANKYFMGNISYEDLQKEFKRIERMFEEERRK